MQDLQITNYEEFAAKGEQIKNLATQFETELKNIEQKNQQLRESFMGADAESYTNKVAEQMAAMKKLQAAIAETGQFIVTVSNTYQEVMNSNRVA